MFFIVFFLMCCGACFMIASTHSRIYIMFFQPSSGSAGYELCQEVHCKGTQQRGQLIDDVFFPWSSKVNPIQVRESWEIFSVLKSKDLKKEDNLWVLPFPIPKELLLYGYLKHTIMMTKLSKRRSATWQRSGLMLRKGREICGCFQQCYLLDFRK